jgi:hypothetical protein
MNTAYAQRGEFQAGYVITSAGDSIIGLVGTKDASLNSIAFKETQGSETKSYSANDIKAYGVGTKMRYDAFTIESGESSIKAFVSCLVKGKVSLYYSQERYFLETGNGLQELVTTTTNVTRDGTVYSQELPKYKGVLQTAMNDCSTIHENLKGTALKENALVKLFVQYHKCIGHPAVVYESGAKIKVSVGIALSGQSSAFDLRSGGNPSYIYLDDNDPMTDFAIAPTFIVELYAAEGKGRFRVRTGLSYFTANYHLYDQGIPGTLDHSMTIDMARIELPLMLKYYPFRKVGLYATAGTGLNFSVKWEPTNVTIVPPATILSESNDLKNNSFFTNPMAGLGFDFPIGKRRIFIEGIYGQSKSVLAPTQNPTSKLNSITFTTGFVF